MLDAPIRARLQEPLATLGSWLARRGFTPNVVTLIGFGIGIAACLAIATGRWALAIPLWLGNRVADGLDGPLARASGPEGATEVGGFLDIMADFAIYGGVIVAFGYAVPDARMAALVVMLAYYLSGSAFLAWSSLATRKATRREMSGDGRSLHFPAGLAEGTETIIAYLVLLALPGHTATVLWIWAGIVGVTVVQRIGFIVANLRS